MSNVDLSIHYVNAEELQTTVNRKAKNAISKTKKLACPRFLDYFEQAVLRCLNPSHSLSELFGMTVMLFSCKTLAVFCGIRNTQSPISINF